VLHDTVLPGVVLTFVLVRGAFVRIDNHRSPSRSSGGSSGRARSSRSSRRPWAMSSKSGGRPRRPPAGRGRVPRLASAAGDPGRRSRTGAAPIPGLRRRPLDDCLGNARCSNSAHVYRRRPPRRLPPPCGTRSRARRSACCLSNAAAATFSTALPTATSADSGTSTPPPAPCRQPPASPSSRRRQEPDPRAPPLQEEPEARQTAGITRFEAAIVTS
jgi:hypothetical protein